MYVLQCAPTRPVWRVRQGFPFHSWGLGVLPQEFFCKSKLWKGHFEAIFKTPEKKGFSHKLGKRVFASKNDLKMFKRFGPEGWSRWVMDVQIGFLTRLVMNTRLWKSILSHTPLCISVISGVCEQHTSNSQVAGQVAEMHRLKVKKQNHHCLALCDFGYVTSERFAINVWEYGLTSMD